MIAQENYKRGRETHDDGVTAFWTGIINYTSYILFVTDEMIINSSDVDQADVRFIR